MRRESDAASVPDYERFGWPSRRPKLHVHDGIVVEIRRGSPDIAIYQDGRLCTDDRLADSVGACMGALAPLASVSVYLPDGWMHPSRIADAVWWADCLGAERPHSVPVDAVLLELPHSEVCMHLRLAGRLRWVAPVQHQMAQIYDEHGARFSIPVLRGEAGLPTLEVAARAPSGGAVTRPVWDRAC